MIAVQERYKQERIFSQWNGCIWRVSIKFRWEWNTLVKLQNPNALIKSWIWIIWWFEAAWRGVHGLLCRGVRSFYYFSLLFFFLILFVNHFRSLLGDRCPALHIVHINKALQILWWIMLIWWSLIRVWCSNQNVCLTYCLSIQYSIQYSIHLCRFRLGISLPRTASPVLIPVDLDTCWSYKRRRIFGSVKRKREDCVS